MFSLILGMSNTREMYNLCLAFVKEKVKEINVRGDVKESMKGMWQLMGINELLKNHLHAWDPNEAWVNEH